MVIDYVLWEIVVEVFEVGFFCIDLDCMECGVVLVVGLGDEC